MILYVGSYTDTIAPELVGRGAGIYCFDFDQNTGSLELLNITACRNPAYLCISQDKKYLYSTDEVSKDAQPHIKSYKIYPDDHTLKLLNEQKIPGGFACHLSCSPTGKNLLLACYQTGNVVVYPIRPDGYLEPLSDNVQHFGTSVNKERQEGPHAHIVAFHNKSQKLYVCDLGIDKVMEYEIDEDAGKLSDRDKCPIPIPAGSGPRHIAFHPDGTYAFVINELTSTVSVLQYKEYCFEYLRSYPSLPDNYTGIPSGAAIRVSLDGRFVYVSNRGCDSIAVFQFEENTASLTLLEQVFTNGNTARDFCLDPSGQWLLAANQDSDSIMVFKVDKETGKLEGTHINIQTKSPVCLQWL
ncbi:MAG: lactonase family protein [Bacteroidetes bacterium]|nr:lactonase family protein [Bacteroidota bacterium]